MTTVWFGHRRILTLASTLLAAVATVGGVAIAATPRRAGRDGDRPGHLLLVARGARSEPGGDIGLRRR